MKPNEIEKVKEEISDIIANLYTIIGSEEYNSHKFSYIINECKSRLEQLNFQIVIVDALENRK